MAVPVRRAIPGDLPKAVALFCEVLQQLPYYNDIAKSDEALKYTPEKLRARIDADPDSVLLVDGDGGSLVGFCFNHFDDYTIWIDWFGVARSNRQRGIGEAILRQTLESARKRKAHKVWCDTRTTNEPSISLLLKVGFRKIAMIPNHWYGQDFILWEHLA